MKVNVPHLAKLANLSLSPSQIKTFGKQLESILGYIDKLNELNVKKVEETSQITGLENVLREDSVSTERTMNQEKALSNAKSKENGLFKVKGIFNEG